MSDALAERLGMRDTVPLRAASGPAATGDGAARRGTGRVGRLAEPLTLAEFTRQAAGDPDRPVRTVAVCGGSGGEFLADARAAGVDAYLTADLRHHPVSEYVAEGGPAVVDAAHWATERPWLDELVRWLGPACAVDTVVSDLDTDPWTVHAPPPTAPVSRSAVTEPATDS